ncbi:DUF2339 domain-containing protein [Nocardia arizonensis]|uniref:DUF2339 domain-containing protein n=1 Tax=Nocardia arizonensis TaxID=1141647 RepID=UPI000AC0B175|nr:DUF2339 domain-containing protein [Nocardia arizonensis]
MTTSIDPALITRLSGEFTALGTKMGVLGRDLDLLRLQLLADLDAPAPDVPAVPSGAKHPAAQSTRVAPDSASSDAVPPSHASPAAGPSPADEAAGADARGGERPAASNVPYGAGVGAPNPAVPQVPPGGAPQPGAVWPGAPAPGTAVPGAPGWAGAPGPGMPYARGGAAPPLSGGAVPPRWGVPAGGWPPAVPPVPPRQVVERTPWWQREGVISRVLAVAGVGVTLIGVVMLLVLAAQAGFFGPVPRVVAGAVFSAALVGAGMRTFGRDGGRVGAIALAATGIAGAYLDVVAVTAVYHWLYPALGLAVAFGVAAGGVALSMRWQSQPLAVLVVAGAAALTPAVGDGLVLLGFLIVLQLACLPVQLVRDWPVLHVVRTLPAALATLALTALALIDRPEDDKIYQLLAAAIAIAVIGLVGTVLVVRRRAGDITATVSLAMAVTPLLVVPVLFDRTAVALIAGGAAAALLAVGAPYLLPKSRAALRIPGHTAAVSAVAGSFALLEVCFGVTDTQTAPIALLLVAIGYLAVAGQRRSRVAAIIGTVFALLGGLGFFIDATPKTLAVQQLAQDRLDISTVLAAIVLLATVAVAVWGLRTLPTMSAGTSEESLLWIAASVAGLYAVTAATVSLGVVSGAADGFVVGHSAATILWMAAATGALFYGLRNLSRSPAVAKVALGSGLLVTAAALAKLFLFDLATLDGLVRVAAFLVVGVLLLVAGTRYARAFAEAGSITRDRGDEGVR